MAVPPIRAAVPLALALALAACGDPSASDAGAAATTANNSLAVDLARVELRPLQRTVVASGPISPWEDMQLGVEVSGLRVTALHVDVGQPVGKGQLLLELDHRTLDSDLRQAQAALGEADAGVRLAQLNFERGQRLAQGRLISASALDELRAILVQAQARLATVRAQRDAAQLRRDFTALRAPDAGIVSHRLVQPGQVVMAGAVLLRLIRQGRLEWRAELAADDLAQVRPGASVELLAAGAVVTGTVRAVAPALDAQTRTGTVFVDLPQPGGLTAGTYLEGRIVTGAIQALVVPAAAVVLRDGFSTVFVVDADGLARARRIEAGAREQGLVEVRRGLAAGDRVVVAGAGFLADGDRVRVVAGAPAAMP